MKPVYKKIFAASLLVLGLGFGLLSFAPAVNAADPVVNDIAPPSAQSTTQAACGLGHVGQCVTDTFAWAGTIAFQIGIFLLALAGALLDFSLFITFSMGRWLAQGQPLGTTVSLAWTIFRDLGNLAFIAALVWASVTMILQMQAFGTTPEKVVVNVIIAAVLVNFSYFFAGALIDASNILSREIYETGIHSKEAPIEPLFASFAGPLKSAVKRVGADTSVAGVFLQQTRLSSMFSKDVLDNDGPRNTQFLLTLSMSLMLVFLTARIFLAVFLSIIARFVILVILLITSPVMILSLINVGPIASWGQQWWKALTSQLVFLPVFLLLMMVAFNVTGAAAEQLQIAGVGYADIFRRPGDVIRVLMVFVLAWSLLRIALRAAQALSQGKAFTLPGVDVLQEPAGQFGLNLGTWITKLPRQWLVRKPAAFVGGQIARRAGPPLRRAASAVQEGYETLDAQLGERIPILGLVPGADLEELRARRQARRRVETSIADILDGYTDPGTETSSDDMKKIRDWAEGKTDAEIADFMRKHVPDANDRERIFESLPTDRRQGVRDAVRGKAKGPDTRDGQKGKTGGGGASAGGKTGGGSSAPQGGGTQVSAAATQRTDELLSEINTRLATLGRDQRRAWFGETMRDNRALLSDAAFIREMKSTVRNLGELVSPEMVIDNDALAAVFDVSDLNQMAARVDVSSRTLQRVADKLKDVGNTVAVDAAKNGIMGFRFNER